MKELANKTDIDIRKEIAAQESALRDFRFAVAGSKSKNVREGRNARKEIARLSGELARRKRGNA